MGRGSGSSGGFGGGNTSISGRDRYGQMQTYSLKGELAAYKQQYSKLEKEFGAAMKEQAKGMTTEQLQKYLPKAGKAIGAQAVKQSWNEGLKQYKGGGFDIGVVSKTSSDWGKSWMKGVAQQALQTSIIKGKLKTKITHHQTI